MACLEGKAIKVEYHNAKAVICLLSDLALSDVAIARLSMCLGADCNVVSFGGLSLRESIRAGDVGSLFGACTGLMSAKFHVQRALARENGGVDTLLELDLYEALGTAVSADAAIRQVIGATDVFVYTNPGMVNHAALAHRTGRIVVYWLNRLSMIDLARAGTSIPLAQLERMVEIERRALCEADIVLCEDESLAALADRVLEGPALYVLYQADLVLGHIEALREKRRAELSHLSRHAHRIYADLCAAALQLRQQGSVQ